MTVSNDPTVRSRQVGAELRRLREAAGLNQADVCRILDLTPTRMSRLESGNRPQRPADVAMLLATYRVDRAYREELLELAGASAQRGWLQPHGSTLAERLNTLIDLEADVSAIVGFETVVVPGLLQTGEYTRAIMRDSRIVPAGEIEDRMATRMARHSVLVRRDPPRFTAILDEPVLHRPVGGPAVLAGQLAHLVDMARRPNIELRVVPASVGVHAGINGPFTVLSFAGLPAVVCLDSLSAGLFLEEGEEIAAYRSAAERLAAAALDPEESVRLIAELAARTRQEVSAACPEPTRRP